jgi:NhaP-type Na+/H+ or K+/H+ antiporter
MPPFEKHPGFINIRSVTQLISGLVFIGLGLYILVSTFENNYVLVGPKKQFFGGILCVYGFVRLIRIYLNWKTQKEYHYEDSE